MPYPLTVSFQFEAAVPPSDLLKPGMQAAKFHTASFLTSDMLYVIGLCLFCRLDSSTA